MAGLVVSRARRFRLERLPDVVARVAAIEPDHILITGDLTTTALASEFQGVLVGLAPLLKEPWRVTMVPGNHDRYTSRSVRSRAFERFFRDFAPSGGYPWLRQLDEETAVLGLDPTQAHFTARGYLPPNQLERAKELLDDPHLRPRRLIIACHYPIEAPPGYTYELASKRLTNAESLAGWLATLGPHIYCCGHVHAAWSFHPPEVPEQLCLNAGSPLLRDHTGLRPPGFLEVELTHNGVSVHHHAWCYNHWERNLLNQDAHFFKR